MDNEMILDGSVVEAVLLAPPAMEIEVVGGENVCLFVEDGQLKATGDMDAGARVFFDSIIKCYLKE